MNFISNNPIPFIIFINDVELDERVLSWLNSEGYKLVEVFASDKEIKYVLVWEYSQEKVITILTKI